VEEKIGFVLVFAVVRHLLDLSGFEPEYQAPSQVQAVSGLAPATMVVHHVLALLDNDQRLRLKARLAELVEESQHLLDTVLWASQGMMARNAPDDVVAHEISNGSDILCGVGGEESLNLGEIGHGALRRALWSADVTEGVKKECYKAIDSIVNKVGLGAPPIRRDGRFRRRCPLPSLLATGPPRTFGIAA